LHEVAKKAKYLIIIIIVEIERNDFIAAKK